MVKQNLAKEIKDADEATAKLQTLTLDAMAPLVYVLEEDQKGSLTVQSAVEAARSALILLGNTSDQMTKERRKRVIKDLRHRGVCRLKLLFGSSFETKIKKHLESLKCFRKFMRPKAVLRGGDQFFQRSLPPYPSRGGGSSYRRRGDTTTTSREDVKSLPKERTDSKTRIFFIVVQKFCLGRSPTSSCLARIK